MEKTAVDYLIQQLNEQGFLGTYCTPDNIDTKRELMNQIISQAKKIEKQQIIDAFEGFPLNTRNSQNGQEYYNQTFKK